MEIIIFALLFIILVITAVATWASIKYWKHVNPAYMIFCWLFLAITAWQASNMIRDEIKLRHFCISSEEEIVNEGGNE